MPITFEEVARLEGRFTRRGREIVARSDGSHVQLLRDALSQLNGRVDSSEFALLSHYLLGGDSGEVVQLALGALDIVRQEIGDDPGRAHFSLRFALQRLRSATGRLPAWQVPQFEGREREDLEALFEAARGDRSFSEEELVAQAREFTATHERSGHHFRHLSAGLRLLTELLDVPDANPRHREAARAALTYFREVSDAIPDDLGPVGLLDDAAVIQRAIAEIYPDRGAIGELLDDVVRAWPFVMDLSFGDEGDAHPVSEFLLVSAALLLTPVLEGNAKGVALALSHPGPLPFLVAVLRALAEVREALDVAPVPTFTRGEHLVGPEGGGEVEFVRYVDCRDEALIFANASECRPEEATHFEILQVGSKKDSIRRFRRIGDLRAFRRAKRADGDLRAGRVEFDLAKTPVGTLERIFGLTSPAVLRPKRGRVLVVGPVGEAKRLAGELRILGTPIVDLLPISRERFERGDFVPETWTRRGPGGASVLSIVETTSEALELAEADETVAAVIAPVAARTNDAGNLCRIASGGCRVLAIPSEHDSEAIHQFCQAGFGFWAWSDEWFERLDWPRSNGSDSDSIPRTFERELRRRAGSRTEPVVLAVPGLERAFSAAQDLESLARRDQLERLAEASSECIGALVRICRFLAPPGRKTWERLQGLWTELEESVRERRIWWRDEWVEQFDCMFAGAKEAVESLRWNNPKFEAVMNWSFDYPAGLVATPGPDRAFLNELAEPPTLLWLDRAHPDNPDTPILVPAWYGQQRMERLLHPPVARSLTLLLYQAEAVWFGGAKAKAERTALEILELAERQHAFRGIRRHARPTPRVADLVSAGLPDPDEIVLRGRRARALQQLGAAADRGVLARLLYFAGSSWVAFTPEHRVLQLVSLGDSGDRGAEQLLQRRASELVAGDLVLLVRGSDRDAIREAVDAIAPAGLRELAAAWRGALERALRTGSSYEELRCALSREGCPRTLPTLRGWIEDDSVIGPRDGHEDVDAILRATGDESLAACLDDCKRAIETLWRLHQKCGHQLTQEVVARVRERLSGGSVLDEAVEIEERVVLVVIDSIDSDLVTVPMSMANRLQEDAWHG